jgi:type 1 glutamine amidotransferase
MTALSRRLLGLLVATAFSPLVGAGAATPKKILFFTKCSNFEHSVVRERAGAPSFAGQVLRELGAKHDIQFTLSKDGSLFTPAYLAQFDAFFFYTSGDLLAKGKDGNPPMTAAGKQALLDAVQNGKGFIGTHSATDTFHTDETAETDTNRPRTWRYRVITEKADPYTRMIGGELIIHGTQQIAKVKVTDPKFPGLATRGDTLELLEEWYSMTNFAPDMHVLLLQQPDQMRDPNANGKDWPPEGWDTPYKRPPYPSTWARMHGKGRVYYTSIGHREDTWLNPIFQEILLGGIEWALGRVDADVTPNLAKVAPNANQLPPVSGPVGGLPKAVREAEDAKHYQSTVGKK